MFLNKKTLDLVKFGKCTELNDEITKNSDIISFVDEEKNTLLHKAVRFRQPKVIACLLDAGAEVDSRDESGWTPLHWGCAYGCKEEVQLLVRFGAKITSKTNSGWTVLHWASAYGSTEIAAFLILKGANPAEQSTDGRSPIDIARSYGKIDMEKYLEEYLGVIKLPIHRAIWERASPTDVEARVESNRGGVQQKDQNGKLPIHYAIEMKSPTEVVEVVLRSYPEGATMKDKKGNLAFHRAIELEAPSPVIRALLSVHKDAAQYPHQDGKLPIFKAIEGRLDLDVISAIAQAYPAGTLIKDANGRLPIHVALQSQESEGHIALALLQTNGSMAAERDNAGVLPLVRALETRAPATLVFELLRSYPQAAHEKGKDGYLPLHRAVDLQYPSELIVTLLEANLSAAKEQGKDGYLPLHRAVDKQAHVAVVEALAAAYPEGMLVKTKDGSLPIHMALDKPTPFPIVNALLARNPAIAREKDRGGILPLSRVLERESDQNLVLAILRAYCAAAAETGRDGNLPLHRAIDLQLAPDVLLEILDASPEACSRRDKTGALSLHKALERMSPLSVTSRVLQAFPEAAWVRDKSIGGLLPIQWAMESAQSDAFVSLLLPYTLPVDRFTGNPVPDVECIWTQILQSTPPEKYLDAVEGTLEACADLVEQLANALDKHGRKALDIATPKCKTAIQSHLHFFGRYELKPGAPEHQSATCIVRLASDYLDEKRPVALKFMRNKDQFERELQIRSIGGGLSGDYVIGIIRDHNGEIDEKFLAETKRKKGYEGYPFCLVMPAADRNLAAVLAHEHIAGKDWEQIRVICRQVAHAIGYMHSKQLIHGDIKPLNIMRQGAHIKLIDLDASASFHNDKKQYSGAKFSSAYVPPELVYQSPDITNNITPIPPVVKRVILNENEEPLFDQMAYEPVLAAPSHDMWALGIVMFQICTGETLFHSNDEDNIDDESLSQLMEWRDDFKTKKLGKVADGDARNLIAQLLSKDPRRRPLVDRVLAHPFLSGKKAARMVGERAEFDVFLSYRVATDYEHVSVLYDMLTKMGITVWWDKCCLQPGEDWEDGFCDGLVKSRTFVALLSRDAISNYGSFQSDSKIDNVLLEQTLSLELEKMGLLDKIFPVLIGDKLAGGTYTSYFRSGCHPKASDVVVDSVIAKVGEHLERQGLGTPLNETATPAFVLKELLDHQAGFLQGEYLPALEAITQTIFSMISRLRLSDRIVHQSEAAWVSVASPGSRVPSVCGGEGQGGSGVKAALAALQTQVKDRDEEIDNLVKDVHQRDKIISDLIVSHEEEIRLLKAAFEVQGGSQLTESGGPVLESGSNTAVSDVASDLFAGNIPMPTRRMSATESIGSASALRQKLQDAKLLESVTPPGTGVMDHNHSPVSTSLAKALEGTMTTTPSFTTTTTTTTTTSPRNGLISPRNVVGGTVSCEDVGGKSSTDETQGTVDSSRSKRTSRHDTSTVIGAVNKHAEPKAAASTAAVPRDPSSSRRKTEQASKAGDSEKKKSNGSGSTNAGGNSHSSSTRSGKPHQQESKK